MSSRMTWVGGVLVSLMTAVAAAAIPVEDSMESQASLLRLPPTASGEVVASSCDACPSRRFAIAPTTMFLVNGKKVAFEELRKLLQANGALQLIVAYNAADQQLSRIVVTSPVRQ